MPWSERVQTIVLLWKKTYKFLKEKIRKTFFKKCRKLFLKTLIQNANNLLVIEELSTIFMAECRKSTPVDAMLNYIKKCFTST